MCARSIAVGEVKPTEPILRIRIGRKLAIVFMKCALYWVSFFPFSGLFDQLRFL